MTPLERKILQHVRNAAGRPDFDPRLGCLLPDEIAGTTLTPAEAQKWEDVLWSMVERGWLAKRADSYYVPTRSGEGALAAD